MSHLRVGEVYALRGPKPSGEDQTVYAARAAECGAEWHRMAWIEVAPPASEVHRAAYRSSVSDGSPSEPVSWSIAPVPYPPRFRR